MASARASAPAEPATADGSRSFPERPAVGERFERGASTWVFLGPAVIETDTGGGVEASTGGSRTYRFVYDAEADRRKKARPLAEKLVGTRAYTRDGVWEIAAVDASRLLPARAGDPGAEPGEEVEVPPIPVEEQWPKDGEVVTWEANTWFHLSCGNHQWWTEDRVEAIMSHSRPQAMVQVTWDNRSDAKTPFLCSGVLLRDNWVLTAAHCLEDNNEVPHLDNGGIDELFVTKHYINQPFGLDIDVEAYYINDDWDGSNDFDDDYALLKLAAPFTGTSDMDLSNATDATLQGVGANFHNLGYPDFGPACTPTDEETLFHASNLEVTAINAVRLRWRGDGGPGHSGGPVYYCPDGDNTVCASGEKGFVVAVWAGWSGTYSRFVGPRSLDFRDWAIDLMDNL